MNVESDWKTQNINMGTSAQLTSDVENHVEIVRCIKCQVKAIMEEAVTKKFVHEQSAHVLRLCGTITSCMVNKLKKRHSGFLKTNKIANLFNNVGKSLPAVAELVTKIEEALELDMQRKKRAENHNDLIKYTPNIKFIWVQMALTEKLLDRIIEVLVENHKKYYEKSAILADPVYGPVVASLVVGPCALDYTKMKTTDHYWSDPPADELMQRHQLHARHANNSISPAKRPTLHTQYLSAETTAGVDKVLRNDHDIAVSSFRDYVESLHQNSKTTLLYGKNNVKLQPKGTDMGAIQGYLSLHQVVDNLLIKWTPNQLMNGSLNNNIEPVKHVTDNDNDRWYWKHIMSINIRDVVYLHCHQQQDKSGTVVFVGQDGVQHSPIHFPPGGHLLAFLTCLESGLLPRGHLDPPLRSQRGKGKVFPRIHEGSTSSSGSQISQSDVDEPSDFVFRVTLGNDTSSDEDSVVCVTLPQIDFSDSTIENRHDCPTTVIPECTLHDHCTIPRSVFIMKKNFRTKSIICLPLNIATERQEPKEVSFFDKISSNIFPAAIQSRHHSWIRSEISIADFKLPEDTDEPPLINTPPIEFDQPPSFFTFQGVTVSEVNEARNRHASAANYSNSPLKVLCDTMRRQIISRAFYGWLGYSRHLSSVRTHLAALVNTDAEQALKPTDAIAGITADKWQELTNDGKIISAKEVMRYAYFGGISHGVRRIVWPYLLGCYPMQSTEEQRKKIDEDAKTSYEEIMTDWLAVEVIVKQREVEAFNLAKLSTGGTGSTSSSSSFDPGRKQSTATINEVFASLDKDPVPAEENNSHDKFTIKDELQQNNTTAHKKRKMLRSRDDEHVPYSSMSTESNVTSNTPSFSINSTSDSSSIAGDMRRFSLTNSAAQFKRNMDKQLKKQAIVESLDEESHVSDDKDKVTSNNDLHLDSSGFTYDVELLDEFGLNLHRIEKDVHRCDRNHTYFTHEGNLDKLRNVMCSFVWNNLKFGYMQGMCDIAAPLLILFDDESMVHSCFNLLMKRMAPNFPHGGAMDSHLANVRSLLQILDSELYEHMHQNGDYTHFYFCYRWFLLDFKRELSYTDDVYAVWERIWTADMCATKHFALFFGLAMLHNYRDIILNNDMDFTDIIKFFNEMAERHDAQQVIKLAQKFVSEVQQLIQK